MRYSSFSSYHSWIFYSNKLSSRIEDPKFAGFFTKEDAKDKNIRLVLGKDEGIELSDVVCFYLLIDEDDGVIADAKFQAFGHSSLIGAAEVACELLMRKNYQQARRITADLIDKQVRDKVDEPAFPQETSCYLNLVISAIDVAADQCMDIPISDIYEASPVSAPTIGHSSSSVYQGWKDLPLEQKIAVIEEVIASDIRPYIELDAGGVQVINVIESKEVIIAYQGSCTSCYSATGATLNAIQQILRARIYPEIVVTPDISFLDQH